MRFSLPLWTAIIPTYGEKGVALTSQALQSLQLATESHEIFVVDDGSPNDVQCALDSISQEYGAHFIALPENGGFAKACNIGLQHANGKVLILWNNDATQINKTCDDLANFCMFTGHGTVGIKLLYPDRTVQHGGVCYVPAEPYGYFDHIGRGAGRWDNFVCRMRKGLCTGAVLAISRNALDMVGLLDERYGIAFEDVDYEIRCMETRLGVFYCGLIEAFHFEGQTRGATFAEKQQHPEWTATEQEARKRFFARWKGVDFTQFALGG